MKSIISLQGYPSKKQSIQRRRFLEAHQFAQSIVGDPDLKSLYEKMAGERCSAYKMAVTEYLVTGNGQWVF